MTINQEIVLKDAIHHLRAAHGAMLALHSNDFPCADEVELAGRAFVDISNLLARLKREEKVPSRS